MCLQIRPGCSHDGSRHQGVPQNTRDNIYNSGDSRCLRSAQCQCSRGTNYLIQIYAMVWFSKCQRWCRFPRPRHRARVCTPTSRSWSTPASTTPASTSTGTTGWSSGTVLYCTVPYCTVVIRAAINIKKGEHISINYSDPMWGTANRQLHLGQSLTNTMNIM